MSSLKQIWGGWGGGEVEEGVERRERTKDTILKRVWGGDGQEKIVEGGGVKRDIVRNS
jgi:hypothetical protein